MPAPPASAASGMAAGLRDVNEHIATGGEDCRYCPVCRGIELVRQTSPEVKAHLAVAASSLLQAAAGLLETQVPQSPARPGGASRRSTSTTTDRLDLNPSSLDEPDDLRTHPEIGADRGGGGAVR